MKPRILVVDDESPIREMLKETFNSEKYEIIDASDGLAAMRVFEIASVDLIITDIFMPGLDGLEVIDEVSSHFPQTKIIAISANVRDCPTGNLEEAMRLGAHCTFPKPFPLMAMKNAVKELIG